MPTRLEKTRKHIAKKRGAVPSALHAKSRDSMRLHAASVRDVRLQKLAETRSKKERPIFDRAAFFHECLQEKGGEAQTIESVQEMIAEFIGNFEEEYNGMKAARQSHKPRRPATAAEDLLKIKINALKAELTGGFCLPDITSTEVVKKFNGWEGSWSYLSSIPWIKINSAGSLRSADFPTKGLN